ncbi:MAG TPA: tetratricopeptide repeat protein [Burkholderiales bacterium]|nr:tetratricopeptide repeat protein [Burkholderiales bacterium]
MSLLLEALKKAEKAKEEAQRRAKDAEAAVAGPFDPEATVLDDGKHVTTRDELPDISAPLEILSDDLRPGTRAKTAPLQLAIADEPPPAPEPKTPPRRESPRVQPETPNAERATAQRVFEAKFKEPNPRLPFYITVGVLSAFALGTVIYFWLQLRPASSLVNTNPVRSADEKPVDTAAAPVAAPAAGSGQPAPGASATPGLPPTPAVQAPAAAASPAAVPPTPVAAAPTALPSAAPAAPAVAVTKARRSKPAAAENSDDRPLTINRGGPQIHPGVSAGYAAYQAGDLAKARSEYQQVLREEPANRDALLGLAAVEMRAQRYDLADGYYQRVLQADPRDPSAQAGMLALRSQQLDPVQVESRVKSLLATNGESNVLFFTLGNQYAQQGRWAEAQQAYFKAFAADPDNPDFAFNLAVSVDQLRQPKLALEYYRRALELAEKRSASFNLESARTRVQQLSH